MKQGFTLAAMGLGAAAFSLCSPGSRHSGSWSG